MRVENLLNISINEIQIEEIVRDVANRKMDDLDDAVFWKKKDLQRKLGMSDKTVQQFLDDPNFPKFKSDRDWRFPVKEVREYMDEWWRNQPKS